MGVRPHARQHRVRCRLQDPSLRTHPRRGVRSAHRVNCLGPLVLCVSGNDACRGTANPDGCIIMAHRLSGAMFPHHWYWEELLLLVPCAHFVALHHKMQTDIFA